VKKLHIRVMDLRLSGMSISEIAHKTKITPRYVCKIMAYEHKRNPIESVPVAVATDVRRLDVILSGMWTGVKRGDVGKTKVALIALEHRRKLIGLDAEFRAAQAPRVPQPRTIEEARTLMARVEAARAELAEHIELLEPRKQIEGPNDYPGHIEVAGDWR
jgi:hypothetical protein